jgi:hypothetical protein
MDLGTWFADSTNVRAPRAAVGAKGGCEALGRSRGDFSKKVHLVCDGLGNPLAALPLARPPRSGRIAAFECADGYSHVADVNARKLYTIRAVRTEDAPYVHLSTISTTI